ncbi:MAG: DUF3592 domain-containing protein [Burkholderiales bacterium]|jgi:hypothetical protein|nr:DUF3592 domain-containing protein [Burkholderiales bacterium]
MPVNLSTEWSWRFGVMPQPWFSVFAALVACALLCVAVVSTLRTAEFDAGALRTTATVLAAGNGGPMTRPVAQFTDANGHAWRVRFRVRSNPPAHHAGEQVGVRYHLEDPADARFDTFLERRFLALLSGVLSLPFFLMSWLAWRFRRRLFRQATRGD